MFVHDFYFRLFLCLCVDDVFKLEENFSKRSGKSQPQKCNELQLIWNWHWQHSVDSRIHHHIFPSIQPVCKIEKEMDWNWYYCVRSDILDIAVVAYIIQNWTRISLCAAAKARCVAFWLITCTRFVRYILKNYVTIFNFYRSIQQKQFFTL